MRDWLKANGGPPAVVLAGLGLISLSPYVGVPLTGVGALWFVVTLRPVQQRIPWQVVRKSAVARQRLSDEGFGKQCLAMAEALHDDLADFDREDPRGLRWRSVFPPDSPEYAAQAQAEIEYGMKFHARYTQKYAARAAWLLHEIEARGLADHRTVWRTTSMLSSYYGIRELAQLLAVIGHRLSESDGKG